MKKIDLEAHFITREYIEYLRTRKEFPKLETIEDEKHRKFDRLWFEPDLCRIRSLNMRIGFDLGEGRIQEMDAGSIDIQISLSDPGCELFDASEAMDLVRKINDELSRIKIPR
jgi:hypothetical protein